MLILPFLYYSQNKNPNPSPISEKFGFVLFGGANTPKGELVFVGNIFGMLIYF